VKVNRWLLIPLSLLALLVSRVALAEEVLVKTTATRIAGASGRNRRSVLFQNRGANSLWCATKAAGATSALGVEVPAGKTFSADATSAPGIWCSTSADQTTGSGTRVMEL
jgi:hypothetical protein